MNDLSTIIASVRLAALMASSSARLASAQDWPQWRGPSRTGRRSASRRRPRGPIGRSRSGRSGGRRSRVADRRGRTRVSVLDDVGEQEAVSARDLATGKEIWRAAYDAPYQMNSGRDVTRQGTEVDAGSRSRPLYTFGISGILSAWQAQDGRLLWRRDFKKDFPSTSPDFGVAMSPIVVGDMRDRARRRHRQRRGAGASMWRAAQRSGRGKGDGPAYASPIVADIAGTRQIITQSQRHVVGLSLADGRLLWEIPFTTEYEQNSITPIVVERPADLRRHQQADDRRADQRWRRASGRSRRCGRTPTCRCI